MTGQVAVGMLGAFLLGGSLGRWFSARKQVAAAVSEALAAASATAEASPTQLVVIGGRHDEAAGAVVYDDLNRTYDYLIVNDRGAVHDDDAYVLHHGRDGAAIGPGRDAVRVGGHVGVAGAGGRGVRRVGPAGSDGPVTL
jgi:hypothetical protein